MKINCRQVGRIAALTGLLAGSLLQGAPAEAQTVTIPQWMRDSSTLVNRYLVLWQYYTGNDITRFNVWTNEGDPLNSLDDYREFYRVDQNGNRTYYCPWGTRLLSGIQPSLCRPGPSGTTVGDDRPIASVFTLRIDTPGVAGSTTQELLYPEDFQPEVNTITITPGNQGFVSRYSHTDPATSTDLLVTQRLEFARDLVRIEYVVKNQGGTTRRVGGRLLLDPYVDQWGNSWLVHVPSTGARIARETEFRGLQVPDQWQVLASDDNPYPSFVAKGYLRGNGATAPERVVFGDTRRMFPWALGNNQYDWPVSNEELRTADIGLLIYWPQVSIPRGSTARFVTYAGVGVATHAMSDAYLTSKPLVDSSADQRGFVGAVQTPFALPLVGGDVDLQEFRLDAYVQNQWMFDMPNPFAMLQLPDGLRLGDSEGGSSLAVRKSMGSLSQVGGISDEGRATWNLQATGAEAGLLPINVLFGTGTQDSARATHLINVPQGRLYEFRNEWRMLTVPFTFGGLRNNPAEAFGLPSGSYVAFRYNPASRNYEQVNELQPGESYWVRMQGMGATPVRLQNAAPVNLGRSQVYMSSIRSGWNQIGNPSPYYVRVKDLQVLLPGGTTYSYDEAVQARYIRPTLWEWDYKQNRYIQLGRESLLNPGRGVWIHAQGERTLLWPAPWGPHMDVTSATP